MGHVVYNATHPLCVHDNSIRKHVGDEYALMHCIVSLEGSFQEQMLCYRLGVYCHVQVKHVNPLNRCRRSGHTGEDHQIQAAEVHHLPPQAGLSQVIHS